MLQTKSSLTAMSFSIILCAGCSNQAMYESALEHRNQACQRMSEGQAREDCLRGYEKTYQQYEQERREIIGDKERQLPKLKLPAQKTEDDSSN